MDLNQIKELREKTGASIGDCKSCLDQANGDFEEAIALLRKKGAQIADKKSCRETVEGLIGSYLHCNGKVAALVVVKCETDFVALNQEFRDLAKDLAMHITAMNPTYRSPLDVPAEVIAKEREIETEKLLKEGKPKKMIEKILEGKLQKFYERVCLIKQPFIKEDKITVEDLINQKIQKIGEKIKVGQFVRLEL